MVGASISGRFSEAIRTATQDIHRQAERTPAVHELLTGRLSRERYARLATQHYFIYEALEAAARQQAGDPVMSQLQRPELERVPSLRDDLAFLLGPGWQQHVAPAEATARYCERLRELGETWAGGLVAHHYVRYMGDLSGGQVLGRIARRTYGFTDADGTRFYRFEGIDDPDAFKAAYRAILDEAPWGPEEQQRIIAEAGRAYEFNIEVFGAI